MINWRNFMTDQLLRVLVAWEQDTVDFFQITELRNLSFYPGLNEVIAHQMYTNKFYFRLVYMIKHYKVFTLSENLQANNVYDSNTSRWSWNLQLDKIFLENVPCVNSSIPVF